MNNKIKLQHNGYELMIDHGATVTPVTLTPNFFRQFVRLLVVLDMRPRMVDFDWTFDVPGYHKITFSKRDNNCELTYAKKGQRTSPPMLLDWDELVAQLRKGASALGCHDTNTHGFWNTPYFAGGKRPVWMGRIGPADTTERVIFDDRNLLVADYLELIPGTSYSRTPYAVLLRMVLRDDGVWTTDTRNHIKDNSDFLRLASDIRTAPSRLNLSTIQYWYTSMGRAFPFDVVSMEQLIDHLRTNYPR